MQVVTQCIILLMMVTGDDKYNYESFAILIIEFLWKIKKLEQFHYLYQGYVEFEFHVDFEPS